MSHIPIFGCLLNIVFPDDKLRSEDSEEATFTYCTLPLPMAEQDLGSVFHILDLVALEFCFQISIWADTMLEQPYSKLQTHFAAVLF